VRQSRWSLPPHTSTPQGNSTETCETRGEGRGGTGQDDPNTVVELDSSLPGPANPPVMRITGSGAAGVVVVGAVDVETVVVESLHVFMGGCGGPPRAVQEWEVEA